MKVLTPTMASITDLSRSFIVNGIELNSSYIGDNQVVGWASAAILILFLLAVDEFKNLRALSNWRGYITSVFAILATLILQAMVSILEFTPTEGLPFLVVGTPILASYLLILGDMPLILSGKASKNQLLRSGVPAGIFIILALFLTSAPPIIRQNLVELFSLSIVGICIASLAIIMTESGNPGEQDRRFAALIFAISVPTALFITMRLLFLLNNPDTVTRERWNLDWSFMSELNTFVINVWPLDAVFGEDSRWRFYFTAIINSARVTLLSILLCTILGIFIGVMRLSSNKLASSMATVYVEVFRNLPLAVLLFLIATQLGETLPLFREEANINGWIFYSNKGIWTLTTEGWRLALFLVSLVAVWIGFRIMDRDGVDDSNRAVLQRSGIWGAATVLGIALMLHGSTMPEVIKPIPESPASWSIIENTAFEITPMFMAMVMGLTLFTASVVAEIVRGSIQSLPRGQVEAAVSLALTPFQRLRLVILPQALRSMIPLLNSQYMNVWKNSSLAIIVAYSDVFYVIFVMMNNVGKLIPLFILLLVTYQAGSLLISGIMNAYNARVTRVRI
ncbi:MAG: ABC transporter permease subunit [Candidatus Thermoplasmatota archaeon]|nr:ABC transporter permease subunit [Candidatus Thermoplasmatota archaeon]MEC8723337.1 ABC transporter permease subunit [Candidatus Thermoplasmatota archaeon]